MGEQGSGPSIADWGQILFPLLPVILGAASTHFKIFIDSQKDFRERVSLKKAALIEQLAMSLASLLRHSRSITADQLLRGDGREEPDLVGDYMQELFRVYGVVYRLELLLSWVRYGYLVLFITTCAGFVGFILAVILPELRTYTSAATIIFVTVQLLSIWAVFRWSHQLESYEAVA